MSREAKFPVVSGNGTTQSASHPRPPPGVPNPTEGSLQRGILPLLGSRHEDLSTAWDDEVRELWELRPINKAGWSLLPLKTPLSCVQIRNHVKVRGQTLVPSRCLQVTACWGSSGGHRVRNAWGWTTQTHHLPTLSHVCAPTYSLRARFAVLLSR